MIALIIVLGLAAFVVYIFGPIIVSPKDSNGYVIDENYHDHPPEFAPIPTAEEITRYTGDRVRSESEIASELPEPEEADVA